MQFFIKLGGNAKLPSEIFQNFLGAQCANFKFVEIRKLITSVEKFVSGAK